MVAYSNKQKSKHKLLIAKHQTTMVVINTASPRVLHNHEWIPTKERCSNNKILKTLKKLYPFAKQDELELMASINTKADIKAHLENMGYDKKEIKEML